MLENYNKLIKCMKILQGFENYRMNNGYGARLRAFSYMNLPCSFIYSAGKLNINTDTGVVYTINYSSNKLKVCFYDHVNAPHFNIQYSDNIIKVTSPALFRYNLELEDLFEEDVHFQYSMIDYIPSIEVLKEAQEIFEMLLNEDISYIGPLELPDFDYDSFLRWLRDQTIYVAEYWECLNE